MRTRPALLLAAFAAARLAAATEPAVATMGAGTGTAQVPLLVQAWRGVVAHHPDYAAALAQREQGRAAAAEARALWLPSLAAQGGVAVRSLDTATTSAQFTAPGLGTSNGVDFRTSTSGGTARQWAFVAQQPLLDAGRSADAAALRARARMAEAQFQLATQQLMLRTTQQLAAVVGAQARLQAVQRQRAQAARARDLAQARFESGDLPVTDWREAQAQADELAVAELDAQQAVAVANAAWSDLTGLDAPAGPAPDVATIAAPAAPGLVRAGLDEWLARAASGSPVLALQREQAAVAASESQRWSRLEGLQVGLVGQVGRETLDGHGDFGEAGYASRLATVGVQATLPLFTGGMRSAQRRAARAGEQAAQAALESARQQVALQVRAAWMAAATADARVGAQERARQSAASRLDATRIGREAGDRTLLEALAAEGAALQADADALRAQCDALAAAVALEVAAGTLDDNAYSVLAGRAGRCGAGPGG